MPNLTPFEIALLVFGAVLVAALAAILWWRLAGGNVANVKVWRIKIPIFNYGYTLQLKTTTVRLRLWTSTPSD